MGGGNPASCVLVAELGRRREVFGVDVERLRLASGPRPRERRGGGAVAEGLCDLGVHRVEQVPPVPEAGQGRVEAEREPRPALDVAAGDGGPAPDCPPDCLRVGAGPDVGDGRCLARLGRVGPRVLGGRERRFRCSPRCSPRCSRRRRAVRRGQHHREGRRVAGGLRVAHRPPEPAALLPQGGLGRGPIQLRHAQDRLGGVRARHLRRQDRLDRGAALLAPAARGAPHGEQRPASVHARPQRRKDVPQNGKLRRNDRGRRGVGAPAVRQVVEPAHGAERAQLPLQARDEAPLPVHHGASAGRRAVQGAPQVVVGRQEAEEDLEHVVARLLELAAVAGAQLDVLRRKRQGVGPCATEGLAGRGADGHGSQEAVRGLDGLCCDGLDAD
mmetsp:Transcript_23058/g.87186  ORF Transcript_23058/g.87186 Transcript_23058/m.87186 type:complete len:386 (+) Transcript_23058:1182-2339(+)